VTSEKGTYPFLPEVYHWYVFDRNEHRYRVGWPRMKIESLTPEAPLIGEEVMRALGAAAIDNSASSIDFITEMERLGLAFVGPSDFNFRSGTLFWQACVQLHLAHLANGRREAILAGRGGDAPLPKDLDWQEWVEVSLQAGSCASAARLLGYASLEAFLNEVLYVRFRDVYDQLEAGSSAGRDTRFVSVPTKLAVLLKQLGVSRKTDWYRLIVSNASIRRGIEHHKLDDPFTDPAMDLDSVAFEDGYSPADVQAFVDAVQTAFEAVHDAFGVELPPTHKPPY
jgi:hypothetical protein